MEDKRQAVIDVALQRLTTQSIGAVRSILTASALCDEAGVSRDTAYRVFSDSDRGERSSSGRNRSVTDAIVRAAADASIDPQWSGAAKAQEAVGEAFLQAFADERSAEDVIIGALEANVEEQFRSPGQPVGWLLQASALTASTRWEGEHALAAEDRALAEHILAQRRAFYEHQTAQYMPLMLEGMSALRIRPVGDLAPEQIVTLLQCLLDGAVLRMLMDPECLDPRLVATAMVRLARAFGEPGTYRDPRRPADPTHEQHYDRILDAAERLWRSGVAFDLDKVAAAADTGREMVDLLLPSPGDVADSVLRGRVMAGGRNEAGTGSLTVSHLAGELHRLALAADELPGAIEELRAAPPLLGTPFLDDLTADATEVVRATSVLPTERTARRLVELSLGGMASWIAVEVLLEMLGEAPAEAES